MFKPLVLWCAFSVLLTVWCFTAGKTEWRRARLVRQLNTATALEEAAVSLRKSGNAPDAVCSKLDAADGEYNEALALVPESDTESRLQIELAMANTTFLRGQAPKAATCLKDLSVRAAIAWSLRKQGAPSDIWREEAVLASERYRTLAESAKREHDPKYLRYQKNVETAINLLQVESPIFDVLAFPGNCPATEDCLTKLKQQRESERQNESSRRNEINQSLPPPSDNRKDVQDQRSPQKDKPR